MIVSTIAVVLLLWNEYNWFVLQLMLHWVAIARVFDAALAQRGDKFQTIPVEQVEVLVSDLLKVPLSDFILETILDRTEGK